MTSSEFQDLIRAARDPWIFLTRFVHTQDPERGVTRFPDWPYLHRLVGVCCRERYLLVPKSRQMLVTWTMVALAVWRALFRERGMLIFLSRNERCAEELLERARFILDHLPPYMRPRLSSNSKEEIAFRTLGSRLLSLPASPNGPRMYSPSSVFWDEMAFTPYDEPIWAALKPALDSGGRFVGVSSSGGPNNLFARFVSGSPLRAGHEISSPLRTGHEISSPLRAGGLGGVSSPITEEILDARAQEPPWSPRKRREKERAVTRMTQKEPPPFHPPVHGGKDEFPPTSVGGQGGSLRVEEGRNSSLIPPPSSLFFVHRIHYSDHPDRRNDAWKAQAALGLSEARWQQEQEISFQAQDDLVYGEFDPQRHILSQDWPVRRDWEIFRAMDFGYRHPFMLWLQLTPEGEVIVFDEWSESDRTTEELLQAVRNVDLVHGLTESDVTWTACDPAGAAAQDAGISPVDILRKAGMKLRYRSSRIAPGVERIKSSLRDASGRAHLRVSPRCRRLIQDFARYRWAANGEEPLKDGHCDHSMDALRYFFVNLDSAREELNLLPRLAGMRR